MAVDLGVRLTLPRGTVAFIQVSEEFQIKCPLLVVASTAFGNIKITIYILIKYFIFVLFFSDSQIKNNLFVHLHNLSKIQTFNFVKGCQFLYIYLLFSYSGYIINDRNLDEQSEGIALTPFKTETLVKPKLNFCQKIDKLFSRRRRRKITISNLNENGFEQI